MYREAELSGLSCLAEATVLLQRARLEHPTQGLWEAADRQWWWRTPRGTDDRPMPFWYDDRGPVAAALLNEWPTTTWLDVITLPSVKPSLLREVLERGLTLEIDGLPTVAMLVDDADESLLDLVTKMGFRPEWSDRTAWLHSAALPEIRALADGYSLHSRASDASTSHHYVRRSGPEVENRLRQTSLYQPDLDLFVVDSNDHVAAYGLFWSDPATGVGLVEPMRTEESHQGQGLARHILTTGIHKLVADGCERVKVSYDKDNSPAVALYLGSGFEPTMACTAWSAPTTRETTE